jgi:hypothetical protein
VRFALNLATVKPQAQRLVGRCADAETLSAAHALGLELAPNVARGAAQSGSMAKLQVFLTQSCQLPRDISRYAASSGSVELLAWLKQRGHSFTIAAMSSAASRGHVQVLNFLRTASCMWDSSIPAAAARGDQLAALQWLRQHECPYSQEAACKQAALGGSMSVMAALVAEFSAAVRAKRLTAMLLAAGSADKLEAAQWLRLQGADWPLMLCYAGRRWPRRCVQWAREQGCIPFMEIFPSASDNSSDSDSSDSDSTGSNSSSSDSSSSSSSRSRRGKRREYAYLQEPDGIW